MVSDSPPELASVHHVGISVQDVGRTVQFWSSFLGVEPRWRQVLDATYLGEVTGYPGVNLDASVIELPGGVLLEILDYQKVDKAPNDMATANPGNVHICLRVTDIEAMRRRAIECGATPTSPGAIEITEGPNQGAKGCYLRDPDGITLELLQPPPV